MNTPDDPPSDGADRPGALASLRHAGFRLLITAHPFSTLGSGVRGTVNAFQVYQLTGDARLLGLAFLFQGLPTVAMGLFGGTLADIMDRRRLLRLTIGLQLVLALILAALTASGRIEVWHLYAATFLGTLLASTAHPAEMALVPALVPDKHLMNATAMMSIVGQAAALLGPIAGGLAIDALGATAAYLIDALLLVPAFAAIWLLRAIDEPPRRKVELKLGVIFEGLTYVAKQKVLLAFILVDTVSMLLGFYPAMMPVMARDVLGVGATGLGVLLAAPATGAMLGFLGVLALGNIRAKGAVIFAAMTAHGLVLAAFAWSDWFLASVLLVGLLGFLDSLSVSIRMTCFQQLAPEHLRGRVMSVLYVTATGSNAFGGAVLGVATALLGPREALAAGGLLGAAFCVTAALVFKGARAYRL